MTPISYDEARGPADGNSVLRLLTNIAEGRFWFVGRQFDPPELQAKKAGLILQELTHHIASLPDPDALPTHHCGAGSRVDVAAQIMLLRLDAEMKFREAVTKAPQPEPEAPEIRTTVPAEPESESVLSGEEKLKAAKEITKSMSW